MAKQANNKQTTKTTESSSMKADVATEPTIEKPADPVVDQSVTADSKRAPSLTKESPAAIRPKKTKPTIGKQSSLIPSEHKLENLAAAISLASNVDNLLSILHHVEAAGGQAEVIESIEAYRALKTAVEQASSPAAS
jgi:hypothetical protein